MRSPAWVSNTRTLVFGGFGQQVNLHDPTGADDDFAHWFDDSQTDTNDTDLGDGELSRTGHRLALIRGFDTTKTLRLYAVSGTPASGSPPPVPTPVCQTNAASDFASPTWSPDGGALAYARDDGIHVLTIPGLDPSDSDTCARIGNAFVIADASEPDWGPANVNPGPRVAPATDPGPGSGVGPVTGGGIGTASATSASGGSGAAPDVRFVGVARMSRKQVLKTGAVTCAGTVTSAGRVQCALFASSRLHLAVLKSLGAASRQARAAGKVSVVVKLRRRALRRLRRMHAVSLVEQITITDAAGRRDSARRTIRLR
jgi:hypothetical protein